ncbi:type II toxin-antitoxin system antitoxin SocA domain-containing protein [Caulobacter sp. CCNWLY153]|uniref:Panacea domain-containing protein n=1 Tax=unclassified Caulobacter TaxID=2648921 RepID=UPI002FF2BF56
MSSAARRLCERSGWTLTNLELQKMLYLAQMQFLGQTNERLIDDTFEAWDYGPVSPSIYHRVKPFGSGAIKDVFHGARPIDAGDIANYLDGAYDALSRYSAGALVAITHWDKGAWAKNYIPGARGIPIPDEDIIAEYRARAG